MKTALDVYHAELRQQEVALASKTAAGLVKKLQAKTKELDAAIEAYRQNFFLANSYHTKFGHALLTSYSAIKWGYALTPEEEAARTKLWQTYATPEPYDVQLRGYFAERWYDVAAIQAAAKRISKFAQNLQP
jgi:hypothetical protein